jgi:hypothetical protein
MDARDAASLARDRSRHVQLTMWTTEILRIWVVFLGCSRSRILLAKVRGEQRSAVAFTHTMLALYTETFCYLRKCRCIYLFLHSTRSSLHIIISRLRGLINGTMSGAACPETFKQ